MNTRKIIVIIFAILFVLSCAPKKVVVTEPKAVAPGDELFFKAEKTFKVQSYGKALEYYKQYMDQYPNGPSAAAALLRIGTINIMLENYAEARGNFNRLLSEYPGSEYVAGAKVGILNAYYYEGKYSEVIQLASVILEEPVAREYIARTYGILGDTYLAMESPEDAVYFYTMAYKNSEAPRKEIIIEKLKTAVNLLDTTDIVALLGHLEEDLPRGYLTYQLGLSYAAEENYDEAIRALSEFVKEYPEHENIQQAKVLIEEFSEKTFYQRTTIGCLLPLSGRYKVYGNRALKGIEFAMAQINSRTENEPVQLIIKDTGSDPGRIVSAVEALVQKRVAAIIGPLVNPGSAAVIAQENGIPIITITQKEKITEIGDNVFRNFLTPEMQVKTIVSYAADELGVRNFAILYPEEKYGRTFMNLFWDEVIHHGGKVVGVESYDPAHTDFAAPIKKLVGLYYEVPEDLQEIVRPPKEEETEKAEEPGAEERKTEAEKDEEPEAIVDFEAIFIPDAPNKAGLIVPQLAYYDIEDAFLLGTNLWHSLKLVEMAKEYVQGAIMPDGFFSDSKSVRTREFVRYFEQTYGEKPGIIEATTFDTAMMLFKIVNNPDVRSRSAIKYELLNLRNYPGVTGLTTFDDTGDAQKQLSLLQIEGKRFVEIE